MSDQPTQSGHLTAEREVGAPASPQEPTPASPQESTPVSPQESTPASPQESTPASPPQPAPRRQKVGRRSLLLVALVAAAVGAAAGGAVGALVAINTSKRPNVTIVREIQPPTDRIAKVNDVPSILAQVEPAVVTISTDQGSGTGMVIGASGQVVTNYHVIAGAN
ncbi:MAG: hypothetical protein ACRDWW_08580 [Acidimicrobiales bacterium]